MKATKDVTTYLREEVKHSNTKVFKKKMDKYGGLLYNYVNNANAEIRRFNRLSNDYDSLDSKRVKKLVKTELELIENKIQNLLTKINNITNN